MNVVVWSFGGGGVVWCGVVMAIWCRIVLVAVWWCRECCSNEEPIISLSSVETQIKVETT